MKNRSLRIFFICIACASLFWIINSLNSPSAGNVELKIEYKNIPVSASFMKPLPDSLILHVEGSGFYFLYGIIPDRDRILEVDFNSLDLQREGSVCRAEIETAKLIKPAIQDLRKNVKFVSIEPAKIQVEYTLMQSRKIPVVADVQYSLRNQYMQSGPVILLPDSIEVTGKEQALSSTSSISTRPLQLLDLHKDVFMSLSLTDAGKNLVLSEKKVWLYIPVEEYVEGEFILPVRNFETSSKKIKILPSEVKIKVRAPISRFARFDANDFTAEIRMDEMANSETVKRYVSLSRLPDRAVLLDIIPRQVAVYNLVN